MPTENASKPTVVVTIATPLEPKLVNRIKSVDARLDGGSSTCSSRTKLAPTSTNV